MTPRVDLWFARDPDIREPALLRQLDSVLSPADQERITRMHFPEDRHQQRVTRALVRLVLSRYQPEVPPASWRFERNSRGRPRIGSEAPALAQNLDFNLSHTRGLVVLAVTRDGQVGVDVEQRGDSAPLAVARGHFSPSEAAALDALPRAEQPLRFQRLWTLKEAYLKAIGQGVAGGLGTVTFHFETTGLRFESSQDPEAARWRFHEFRLFEDYLVALAFRGRASDSPPEVTLREFPASGEEQGAQA